MINAAVLLTYVFPFGLFQTLNFDDVEHADHEVIDDGAKDTSGIDPPYDPTNDDILEYNLANYPEFIAACLSCGLSNRKTAKLINALFVDSKIDAYVSPEKVRLLKEKHLKALNKRHEEETKNLIGIGVDGKCGIVKETHCQSSSKDKQSIIDSTSGNYVDHVIPVDGSADEISSSVHEILKKYNSIETLLCVNMDGCKVNTGIHRGVIRHLEAFLQRPLTWIICSLHGNEKVFTHLFEAIGKVLSNQNYVFTK